MSALTVQDVLFISVPQKYCSDGAGRKKSRIGRLLHVFGGRVFHLREKATPNDGGLLTFVGMAGKVAEDHN